MPKPSEDSQQHESKWLDPTDFKFLCFDLTRTLLSFNEPIPDFSTRDDGLLKSALGSPQQSFDGKLLYPTLEEQASILFYSLIKNHPFRNGNKRIGVMSLLAFLSINNMWLMTTPVKLYEIACKVSISHPSEKDAMIKELNTFILTNCKPAEK